MLSKPNVNDLMEKAGNRYEAALSIAKRARQIERRRLEKGDPNIKDAVDQASCEICDQKTFVKKNGEYIAPLKDEELDMDTVISETVDGILKDLAVDVDVIEKVENEEKVEEIGTTSVTKLVDEKKTKIKKAAAAKGKNNE